MNFKKFDIKSITSAYERERLQNKALLQERKALVFEKYPRISEIDKEIKIGYLEAARLSLQKDVNDALIKEIQAKSRELTKEKKKLLVEAGYPKDYLDPIYCCKSCKDTGYVGDSKCQCFIKRLTDALYLQSNLQNILSKENFNTFSTEYYSKENYPDRVYTPYDNINNILNRSRKFIENFDSNIRDNLLIYGETGLGKTFLTNCIAKELLDKNHTVLYLSANELFENVLAEYLIKQKDDMEALYNYIYSCELLVIDDLGTEFTNNFVMSQLFEIINTRKNRNLSTLISTNLSVQQLRDRYSERIMSRIIDSYTVFNIYGDNIRYIKRKKAITQAN